MGEKIWTNLFLAGILAVLIYKFVPRLWSILGWIYLAWLAFRLSRFVIVGTCKAVNKEILMPIGASYQKFFNEHLADKKGMQKWRWH